MIRNALGNKKAGKQNERRYGDRKKKYKRRHEEDRRNTIFCGNGLCEPIGSENYGTYKQGTHYDRV